MWGFDCLNCRHECCDDCSNLGHTPLDSSSSSGYSNLSSSPLDRSPIPGYSMNPIMMLPQPAAAKIIHLRAKRQHLPIYIEECFINACADSGSEVNCITETLASLLGADVKPHRQTFKLPIKDRVIISTGRTKMRCRFPEPPCTDRCVEFFVFHQLITDVIVGAEFLTSTCTLTTYRLRLRHISGLETLQRVAPVIQSVGIPASSVSCWVDGIPILSLPDTGADLNLISRTFAASRAKDVKNSSAELLDHLNITTIQFADCSTTTTRGSLRLTVSFEEPSKCSESARRLVEPSSAYLPRTDLPPVPRNTKVAEIFHIVDNLDHDVILCETLLSTLDAFNRYEMNFVSSRRSTFNCISVGKAKKGKERGTASQMGPLPDTAARFTNDYNNASDSYEKESSKIDESFLYGAIPDEQVPARRARAYQVFLDWAGQNKARFDRFRPGFYEQKFPAENLDLSDQTHRP
ncbi:hypothetical protein DL98DRAFT_575372 [Cadophora sp. DSE1049]|nr:hypothetical protein DL98DRAFT_575372 [Cadophora sp. DSE1049]